MTRLVVLSDTHLESSDRLPAAVLSAAREADLIVHLGDFTDPGVASYLESLGPLAAVHGNWDPPELRARFPRQAELDVDGYRVALLHGHEGGRTALEAARATDADIVLYGHSHQPGAREENGKLLFNPGSPTRRRFAPEHTYGILTLDGGIRAEIISLR